jgi:hypothetical protein
MNVLFGVVLIYYANAAPKMLAPLSKRRCEPAAVQSIQRFSGWTLVLAGLAYCIIWLGAPLEVATVASTLAVASGLAIVLTRCLVLRLWPKQTRTGT